MRTRKQFGKRRSGFLAMALALALAVPQVAVANVSLAKSESDPVLLAADTAATGSAASGTATNATELRKLIKANLLKDYDPAVSGEMNIVHEERSREAQDILTFQAQCIKSNAKGKTVKYQVYDIDKDEYYEMFIMYPSGKKSKLEVYRYDDDESNVVRISTIKNVSDVYKNTKKKQIVVVSAPSAKKTTIATYKLTASGKLKSVSTYTQNKKTYKNGKKKITKKAFVKFYKSVKKLAKIKVKNIPADNFGYGTVDNIYLSSNLVCEQFMDEVGKESIVMAKGDAQSQDKYLAYSVGYDSVGYHEYTVDPGITKYVLGPDVVNAKTGKTYQQEDWEELYKEVFLGSYAPPFMVESLDENGKTVLDIEADSELGSVDAKECTAKNGSKEYKAKEYTFEYGDCQMRITFFTEGPQAGRIAGAGIYYPNITGNVAHDKWAFTYGSEIKIDFAQVQEIKDWIAGTDKNATVRTLEIKSDDAAMAQTIKSNDNVSFKLYSRSGQFYTFKEDGTTKWEYSDELSEKSDAEFDDLLNPATGQLNYGDSSFPKGLFWKAN